jgi:hypothetical protein
MNKQTGHMGLWLQLIHPETPSFLSLRSVKNGSTTIMQPLRFCPCELCLDKTGACGGDVVEIFNKMREK